jgi:hypothetical protein
MSFRTILVLGHGGHGKDTFAELLCKYKGMTSISSSKAAFGVIKPVLRKIFPDKDNEQLYEERREHRELWRHLINLYNTPDPSALTKLILMEHNIYVGMRSKAEFDASAHMFDTIYWVDASERVKTVDESMQIPYSPSCMHGVSNNGSLMELEYKVRWLR